MPKKNKKRQKIKAITTMLIKIVNKILNDFSFKTRNNIKKPCKITAQATGTCFDKKLNENKNTIIGQRRILSFLFYGEKIV